MWFQIGLLLLSVVVLIITRPKIPSPTAATLEDLGIPKAKEGEEIGEVFGTMWLTDPQIVWYGDFKTEAIVEKSGK